MILTKKDNQELTELNLRWLTKRKKLPVNGSVVINVQVIPRCSVVVTVESVDSPSETLTSELDKLLARSPRTLQFAGQVTRIAGFLSSYDIVTIGELVRKSDTDFLYYYRGVGKTTLDYIKQALAKNGLKTGMAVTVGPLEKKALMTSPVTKLKIPYDIQSFLSDRGFRTVSDVLNQNRIEELKKVLSDITHTPSSSITGIGVWLRENATVDARLAYVTTEAERILQG